MPGKSSQGSQKWRLPDYSPPSDRARSPPILSSRSLGVIGAPPIDYDRLSRLPGYLMVAVKKWWEGYKTLAASYTSTLNDDIWDSSIKFITLYIKTIVNFSMSSHL